MQTGEHGTVGQILAQEVVGLEPSLAPDFAIAQHPSMEEHLAQEPALTLSLAIPHLVEQVKSLLELVFNILDKFELMNQGHYKMLIVRFISIT